MYTSVLATIVVNLKFRSFKIDWNSQPSPGFILPGSQPTTAGRSNENEERLREKDPAHSTEDVSSAAA